MLNLRKRHRIYHMDWTIGAERLRGTLHTKSRSFAKTIRRRLENAAEKGPESQLWFELRCVLPRKTFNSIAKHFGVKDKYTKKCADFLQLYLSHRQSEHKTGDLAKFTLESYTRTVKVFGNFLIEMNIERLKDVDSGTIKEFEKWRRERIRLIRRNTAVESTLQLELNHLHHVFQFALEEELIEKNPVRFKRLQGGSKKREVNPFKGEEMLAMAKHAGDDLLLFLLLKETGFRRSDVACLVWAEVFFDRGTGGEIEKVCKKNGARVIVPLSSDLREALEAEFRCRTPVPEEAVLLLEPTPLSSLSAPTLFEDARPRFAIPLSEPDLCRREHQIYRRVKMLGEKAGVTDARPHRFRHYFAVNSVVRGANPMLVARMMGDTPEVFNDKYLKIIEEIRNRLQFTLQSGIGLEEIAAAAARIRHNHAKLPSQITKTKYLIA